MSFLARKLIIHHSKTLSLCITQLQGEDWRSWLILETFWLGI